MVDAAILDPAVLETLRQLTPPGEPDVLTDVLTLFLQESPRRVEQLRNAYAVGDIQEVQRSAHSLKGSAGNIGAHRLLDVCRQLDEHGKAGAHAHLGPLVDALGVEFGKVEVEIRRLIQAT